MRIAVLDDYSHIAAKLPGWPQDTRFYDKPIEDLAGTLGPYEVLVLMRERTRFPREVLEQLPNLKLLITTGMRNAAVDVEHLEARGVTVCGTGVPGYGQQRGVSPTVELAWALILAAVKRVPAEDQALRRGVWQQRLPTELAGKTLGLLGLGRLGQQMVAPAKAFGMDVIAWSENLSDERVRELAGSAGGVLRAPSLDALLQESDIVSIHLVLSERTHHLLGEAQLKRMKAGALLVNTSRGPIVDQSALIHGLRAGQPAVAALDVFDEEPLPKGHPLTELENVVLTPHLGYATQESLQEMWRQCIEDLDAYIAGQPIRVLR